MTEHKLLNDVKKLRKKYERKKDFNVFEAIRFRSQEVMHSKFIATLLDPKGQHKMGIKFLEKFLERIKYSGFDTNNVKVWPERPAKRRWIDITVENNDTIFIIENKIWAEDQPQQLEDYYKFCFDENKWEKVEVFFLTPYGHKPSEGSIGEKIKIDNVKVKLISYEKHVIPWIFECSRDKEVKGHLKSSLEMYHEILQTVINRSHYMNEIFEELKKDKSKLKLAIDITSTLQGRNYIKEFPEIIEFLIGRISNIMNCQNLPGYPEKDGSYCLEISEFENWCIRFFDIEVYATDDNGNDIDLFDPRKISDLKLRSLIFEEAEVVDEWLKELFEDIKKKIK